MKILRDLLIFAALSFLPYSVYGEEANQRVPLSRGTLTIPTFPAESLSEETYCNIVKKDWGWASCGGIDAMIVAPAAGVDTLMVNKPVSDGYVEFDDWEAADKDEAIEEIEDSLYQSVARQAEVTGDQISFEGWHTYPTLVQSTQTMFYATKLIWDGVNTINITATKFDRYGYVEFSIVPEDPNLSESEVRRMISTVLGEYSSDATSSYASFTTGDKVAAAGALGVLATLVGVKYGKGFFAAALALLMVFLKKAWILVLLPFYWLAKKIFGRSN